MPKKKDVINLKPEYRVLNKNYIKIKSISDK